MLSTKRRLPDKKAVEVQTIISSVSSLDTTSLPAMSSLLPANNLRSPTIRAMTTGNEYHSTLYSCDSKMAARVHVAENSCLFSGMASQEAKPPYQSLSLKVSYPMS